MSDLFADLQRTRILQQAEAAAGDKLILKKVAPSTLFLDIVLYILAFALAIPTNLISVLLYLIYVIIKLLVTKNMRVKNIATGEIFKVSKKEFREYKKQQKRSKNEVRSIM